MSGIRAIARKPTPHFLCPRLRQSDPISSLLQLPKVGPQWGTPVPFAGSWKLGGVGCPSLPPVPCPKVRLTQEDSCEEALAAGQPWRSLVHGACKCEALSCLQGDLRAPRMEASGDADAGGTEAPRGEPGLEGACRQLQPERLGTDFGPWRFPCVSFSILGWLLLVREFSASRGKPRKAGAGSARLPRALPRPWGALQHPGEGRTRVGRLARPHEGHPFPGLTLSLGYVSRRECSQLATQSGSWILSHRNNLQT